jgi:predicted CXXCH cytochrome family protein
MSSVTGTSRRRLAPAKLGLLLALAAVAALAAPALAGAANAYNQTFLGQSQCLNCHYTLPPSAPIPNKLGVNYESTRHGQFFTDIEASATALVPGAAKWPSPSVGNGLRFAASEIKWMVGAPGRLKEYVTIFPNDVAHPMASGQSTVPTTGGGPADDFLMVNGAEWSSSLGIWELGKDPVAGRPYFQSCGGCHHLGVTRPGFTNYTLGSGASQTHSTETSVSGLGIQCENCHGTGEAAAPVNGGHHQLAQVKIVRTTAVLKSQVCGQCHVTGDAKEKNYLGIKFFSSPNGYTADRKLSDFFDAYGTVAPNDFVKGSRASAIPTIPLNSSVKFYPNGSNKSMHHVYYNEWAISPHARSLRYRNGDLWTAAPSATCLPCHSGEAFLKSIGYGAASANDVYSTPSSVASDTLNIECAVCHTVHSTSGEALGLRLEPTELCSKCHNGEIEEGAKAPLGKALHHTIREMFNGYGMIGVPDSSELFMQGTGCIDCHMPETRAERKTHSFRVMTPGNAKAWGVPEGGDSCTHCHPGMTRDELQAKLDGWKSEIDALIRESTTTVAAAKSRPASTTVGGNLLILSAEANRKFVEGDGSSGGHNFPYAKAGLLKSVEFAKAVGAYYTGVGCTGYSPATGIAVLYGSLKNGDGTAVAGKTLTIQRRALGSATWEDYDTAATSASGAFGLAVMPAASHAGPGSTEFRVVWNPGVAEGTVYSATQGVTIGSATSVSTSRRSQRLGYSTVISGAVSPNHTGRVVTVQYKRGTGRWATLAYRTLSSTSTYSITYRPRYRGTYYFRTIFGTDVSHAGSTSGTVSDRVY